MRNSRGSNRHGRIAASVAVAAVAVTAFASLGGVGLAQNAIGLHQYQYGKKVTICHKGKKTVSISVRAWPAHKRHGDSIGLCDRKAWKKHREHEQHVKLVKHGKHDKGADSRDAKNRRKGGDTPAGVVSSGRSDSDSSREQKRGERPGKGEGHGNGKGNGKG